MSVLEASTSPTLWYVNRGTGIVLLALLTASMLLGVVSAGRRGGGRFPSFVNQYLHRYLSALAVLVLAGHVASAVADDYVDIRWYDAAVPGSATYQTTWMAWGALGFDVLAVVVATSLVRSRMSARWWRLLHLTSYAAWTAGLVHGLGIGTDSSEPWLRRVAWVCAGLLVVAAVWRLVVSALRRRSAARTTARLAASVASPRS